MGEALFRPTGEGEKKKKKHPHMRMLFIASRSYARVQAHPRLPYLARHNLTEHSWITAARSCYRDLLVHASINSSGAKAGRSSSERRCS